VFFKKVDMYFNFHVFFMEVLMSYLIHSGENFKRVASVHQLN
jgi:hypothetical protein